MPGVRLCHARPVSVGQDTAGRWDRLRPNKKDERRQRRSPAGDLPEPQGIVKAAWPLSAFREPAADCHDVPGRFYCYRSSKTMFSVIPGGQSTGSRPESG